MSYRVRIRRAAEMDLIEAQRWYEQQQRGLAARFHEEFSITIKLLADTPRIYPELYRNVRRAVVHCSLIWSGIAWTTRSSRFLLARTVAQVPRAQDGAYGELAVYVGVPPM